VNPGWRDAAALTRPRQWPILSAQLAVGFLLAAPGREVAAAALGAPWTVAAAWAAWVVMLNGGTLAYNSAWDRDTGPVAYLARPPQPPRWLAGGALAAMAAGAVLGFMAVSPAFGHVTAACVLLSVLYSHPASRWKSRPGLDLLVNMAGYGGGTTLAGLLAARAAGVAQAPADGARLVAGFALLFGSLYPLTQIYQAEDDRRRGDRTLATALGGRRALGAAGLLGLGAALLLAGIPAAGAGRTAVSGAVALWLLHLAWWFVRGARWDAARQHRGMQHALVLWAAVDAALVAAHLAGGP